MMGRRLRVERSDSGGVSITCIDIDIDQAAGLQWSRLEEGQKTMKLIRMTTEQKRQQKQKEGEKRQVSQWITCFHVHVFVLSVCVVWHVIIFSDPQCKFFVLSHFPCFHQCMSAPILRGAVVSLLRLEQRQENFSLHALQRADHVELGGTNLNTIVKIGFTN